MKLQDRIKDGKINLPFSAAVYRVVTESKYKVISSYISVGQLVEGKMVKEEQKEKNLNDLSHNDDLQLWVYS